MESYRLGHDPTYFSPFPPLSASPPLASRFRGNDVSAVLSVKTLPLKGLPFSVSPFFPLSVPPRLPLSASPLLVFTPPDAATIPGC